MTILMILIPIMIIFILIIYIYIYLNLYIYIYIIERDLDDGKASRPLGERHPRQSARQTIAESYFNVETHWPNWVFITGGCSGRGMQWIGVVLYNKLVYNII